MRPMDGLLRSVGTAMADLFAGVLSAIGHALTGAVDAVTSTVPPAAFPVVAICVGLLFLVMILRR